VRLSRGKQAEGRLLLRAYHEGGQVNIEISDDGGGLDAERLKAKAVEKGMITQDQAARMSEREAVNLIFAAGLSTAKAVTNISGRGVGMDVVKTNIEKIGGTVDVQSRLGVGTTLKIKIPLTLAIIPALVITTAGNRFAIPQVNLVELVRRELKDGDRGIEQIHGAPVYRLRGNLLPLVDLGAALGFPANNAREALNLVVLQADGRTFGLVVDEVNDSEEIVVKPLSQQLKGNTAFAGATIMGDGRVALILDVLGIAQSAHVVTEARDRRLEVTDGGVSRTDERRTLLVGGLGGDRRVAIPLSSVARLEEFRRVDVESAGGYEVVQYRDRILPLLSIASALGVAADAGIDDALQVVVYTEGGRSVGLVLDRILDIVEEHVSLHAATKQEGMLGSAVIQRRVTDVLDMSAIVRTAAPWLLDEMADEVLAA
jgi:two-component system, chemotaxis family, sensor kinase CheA